MSRGKNINLFLMDGDASGRIKCTLANWTGVAYKIPRTEIEKCKNREDLKWSGVYFLFGVSDDTGESIAYIGQASGRTARVFSIDLWSISGIPIRTTGRKP